MKRRISPNANYLYLLQCEGTDVFKIGISYDPDKRRIGIQSGFPFNLIPIYAQQFTERFLDEIHISNLEAAFHEVFNHRRLNGEWFRLTPEEVQQVIQLLKWVKENELFLMGFSYSDGWGEPKDWLADQFDEVTRGTIEATGGLVGLA